MWTYICMIFIMGYILWTLNLGNLMVYTFIIQSALIFVICSCFLITYIPHYTKMLSNEKVPVDCSLFNEHASVF